MSPELENAAAEALHEHAESADLREEIAALSGRIGALLDEGKRGWSAAEQWRVAHDEARSDYASVYELLKEFDNYGTDGDASACAREVLQQLSEDRAEAERWRTTYNSLLTVSNADVRRYSAAVERLKASESIAHDSAAAAEKARDEAWAEVKRLQLVIDGDAKYRLIDSMPESALHERIRHLEKDRALAKFGGES